MEDFHEHRMRVLKLRGLEDDETFNQDITSIRSKACQHSKIDQICYAEIVRTMQGIPSLLRERLLPNGYLWATPSLYLENQFCSPQQGEYLTQFCGNSQNHGREIIVRNSDKKMRFDNKIKQGRRLVDLKIVGILRVGLGRITPVMKLLSSMASSVRYESVSAHFSHTLLK
jgi:hypothetical protein